MCVFVGPQVCFVCISQFANEFWFLLFSPSQEAVSVWTDVLSRDETTAATTAAGKHLRVAQPAALEAPEGNTGAGLGLFIR